ncbi:MAG TPA: hypothetical protein VLB44_03260 [Kofleriaceae bacterium]|nr:hypothetical protein [Kofleriaceae bacterium]
MLGVGIGLLLSDRLRRQNRLRLGGPLLAIGALTTIPFVVQVRRKLRAEALARTELDGVHVPIRERWRDFELAESPATD